MPRELNPLNASISYPLPLLKRNPPTQTLVRRAGSIVVASPLPPPVKRVELRRTEEPPEAR